jgi:hypothetical protein
VNAAQLRPEGFSWMLGSPDGYDARAFTGTNLAGGPHFEAKGNAEGGPGLRSAAELTWGRFTVSPGIGERRWNCFAGVLISPVGRPLGLNFHPAIRARSVVAEAAPAGPPARAALARAGVDGQSSGQAQSPRFTGFR